MKETFDVAQTSDSLQSVLRSVINREQSEEAFYVVDLARVAKKLHQWRACLPRVDAFYAVKCNPDAAIVALLASQGASFDCASKAEINSVMSCGVAQDRILYANPCKAMPELRYAHSRGITMMTFDNVEELHKIKKVYNTAGGLSARLVLRILVDDDHSHCPLGSKFGADLGDVPALLKTAQDLELEVFGVSFHVGSGCYDPIAWVSAIKDARKVFDMATEAGFKMTLLDLGGGYPGVDDDKISIEAIARGISPVLDCLFPADEVRVIAEPGRYFVETCTSLCVNVFGKQKREAKDVKELNTSEKEEAVFEYFVNEGVYGMFKDHLLLDVYFEPNLLSMKATSTRQDSEDKKYTSVVYGPTGDSKDCINASVELPELQIGDWLYFTHMGAYSVSIMSCFNGFTRPKPVYVFTK
eukprot:GILJ01000120.1.p1 GENE.GILJ01000120.1~~GILJ01000120.1.p1  ORF type:complete len:483 (+),score=53.04 GILJ01000120.1:212-1450(+)